MRVLLELWTGIGSLIRSLPVVNELQRRGHQIEFVAHDHAANYMIKNGFVAADIEPKSVAARPVTIVEWRNSDVIGRLRGFGDLEWLEATQTVWRRYMKIYKPDLVISDVGLQSAIAARTLNIPRVMIAQSFFHPDRFAGRLQYWREPHIQDNVHETADIVNEYLARFQAQPISRFDDLFVGENTIIPGFPEFDTLKPEATESVFYSGPILWGGIHAGKNYTPPKFDNDNPVVFLYTGRMNDMAGNSGELLSRSIVGAAKKNKGINVLISTGGMDSRAECLVKNLPSNVKVVDWLPMDQALDACDVVIHHGGHGSCMASFKYGKPTLVIPTHTERNYNAHRMQDLQCGIIIERDEISDESMLVGIEALLNQREYKRNVKKYQKIIKERYLNSEISAANYVESRLEPIAEVSQDKKRFRKKEAAV